MNKGNRYLKHSYINSVVRTLAFCLGLILLLSGPLQVATVFAATKNSSTVYTLYPNFRIALDGTVYNYARFSRELNNVK